MNEMLFPSIQPNPKKVTLLTFPEKVMRRLFKQLNPVDCFNLAQCSPEYWKLVKKHNRHEISTMLVRFDDEKSCVAAYFRKSKYKARVFYSWTRNDGKRVYWTNSYLSRASKLQSLMFNARIHLKEISDLQRSCFPPTDYVSGMMRTYKELTSLFKGTGSHYIGVNVNDQKSCQRFSILNFPKKSTIRLIGSYPANPLHIDEVMENVNAESTSIRVAYTVGEACMHPNLLNTHSVELDHPNWLTRQHLLSLNNTYTDIGHNHLTAEDLNAFFRHWLEDVRPVKCCKLDITLNDEAFKNKKKILERLPWFKWDPKVREGEWFDTEPLFKRKTIKDPTSFLDCKYAADIRREHDGALGSIVFYGRRLHFIIWHNPYPYKFLKRNQRNRKLFPAFTPFCTGGILSFELHVWTKEEMDKKAEARKREHLKLMNGYLNDDSYKVRISDYWYDQYKEFNRQPYWHLE